MKRKLWLLPAAVLLLQTLTACGTDTPQPAAGQSGAVYAAEIEPKAADEPFCTQQADFALDLFRRVYETKSGENVMLSPYSVMQAMTMTANGAAGDTRTEMQQVLGGEIPLETLDQYLYAWRTEQPHTDRCKLETANAIWMRDKDFTVRPEFLNVNREWFGADSFLAPFDQSTVKEINGWVKKHTDDMIPKVIERLSPQDMMVLVNAVCFDAKWQNKYEKDDIKTRDFLNADGTTTEVEMMYSDEQAYLSLDGAEGFLRDYDGPYAFAGILPPEDMSPDEYLASLDGKSLYKLLTDVQGNEVRAGIPPFAFDTDTELQGILKEMGMPAAFSDSADFSGISEDVPLRIDTVIHKTHVEVDAEGTKAAAVTAVTLRTNGELVTEETKYVILDRPFIFMIVDTNTHLPVFLGVVKNLSESA